MSQPTLKEASNSSATLSRSSPIIGSNDASTLSMASPIIGSNDASMAKSSSSPIIGSKSSTSSSTLSRSSNSASPIIASKPISYLSMSMATAADFGTKGTDDVEPVESATDFYGVNYRCGADEKLAEDIYQEFLALWENKQNDQDDETELIIYFVPLTMSANSFRQLLSQYGPLEICTLALDVKTSRSKGYGVAKYDNAVSARTSLTALDGRVLNDYKLNAEPLKVVLAGPRYISICGV